MTEVQIRKLHHFDKLLCPVKFPRSEKFLAPVIPAGPNIFHIIQQVNLAPSDQFPLLLILYGLHGSCSFFWSSQACRE